MRAIKMDYYKEEENKLKCLSRVTSIVCSYRYLKCEEEISVIEGVEKCNETKEALIYAKNEFQKYHPNIPIPFLRGRNESLDNDSKDMIENSDDQFFDDRNEFDVSSDSFQKEKSRKKKLLLHQQKRDKKKNKNKKRRRA